LISIRAIVYDFGTFVMFFLYLTL